MPDEEIDKIIRDAASQHHPPYDDEAWGKMEVLLNKHLPQKKDRKKPVIFLLSFLLLVTALFFAAKNYQNKNQTGIAENNSLPKTAPAEKENKATGKTGAENTNTPSAEQPAIAKVQQAQKTDLVINGTTTATENISPENLSGRNKNVSTNKGHLAVKIKVPPAVSDEVVSTNDALPGKPGADLATNNTSDAAVVKPVDETNAKDIIAKDENTVTVKTNDSVTAIKATGKNDIAGKVQTTTAKKKTGKSFASKIAVTVSAGADLSFIDINNAGKLKPVYGAGLSYALGKHLTIASGLLVSKKIYTAMPGQYKITGYVNPNLTQIDADCKVYEIPLAVYYNFAQAKKHSWLAGAGLSSFLMKTETYDYQYKNAAGQSYNYIKKLSNENKHYFSVLALSGGYQYKLNNKIALTAEPYVKIPLGGVGLGKVKLNSTGILITASVKPFAKRK